jgi:hypothetical protein
MGTFELVALSVGIVTLIATIGIASSWPVPAPRIRRRELPVPGFTGKATADILPVSVYLADAGIHYPVQAAATKALAAAGLRIHSADDPVLGSWFRHLRAAVDDTSYSPAARGGTLTATRTRAGLALTQDAMITSALLENADAVITALLPTRDAVVRLGAVLIVKANGAPVIAELTPAQQARLDSDPSLAAAPRKIAAALGIAVPAARRA